MADTDGATATSVVFEPRVAAELPEGWTVTEGSTFTSPTGSRVHVRLTRPPDGWDVERLLDEEEGRVRADLSEVDEVTSTAVEVGGRRHAPARRFTYREDGDARVGLFAVDIVGGLAALIGAAWSPASAAGEAEALAAIAGIRVRVTSTGAGGASRSQPVHAGSSRTGRWSSAELVVLASLLGEPSFPTVPGDVLAALPEPARDLVRDAVVASLAARGLVSVVDGCAAVADDLLPILEVALHPDLRISVERRQASGATSCWFGVREEHAVAVAVMADGARQCTELDPEEVVGLVLELGGAGGTPVDGTEAGGTPAETATLDELLDPEGSVVAVVSLRTSWWDGSVVRGGELWWALGADGSVLSAVPDGDGTAGARRFRLTAIDPEGLRDLVVDHLPGP